LLEEYKTTIATLVSESGEAGLNSVNDDVFGEGIEVVKKQLKVLKESSKKAVESADKKEKKCVQAKWDEKIADVTEIAKIVKEAHWLYSKFGNGTYQDISGLCKIAYITSDKKADENDISIEDKGWSLNPGAYVGVAPIEDDGVDFEDRMAEIHQELLSLQAESNELMDAISQNMKEMGL